MNPLVGNKYRQKIFWKNNIKFDRRAFCRFTLCDYITTARCVTTQNSAVLSATLSTTLTEGFPYFFLSYMANARVKPAKTGHGPHSSYFLCCSMYFFVCCSMYCLSCVVLCIVCVYMCNELLPPGGYPIAVNPLNPELNPICYLLALLAHHFLHVSRIRVKSLTLRLLMSYIYGAPILDVSRSHTTTQHSR